MARPKSTSKAKKKNPSPTIKVLIDNDRVRVSEVRIPPGAKSEMHTHPAYVAYSLAPSKLKVTLADGSTKRVQKKPGTAAFSDGITHMIENVGSTEMASIDIELKK